jgi:Carboxypeptidase regulatory-like domain
MGALAAIDVSRRRSSEATVHLKWPTKAPIGVRTLRGTLRFSDWPPGAPQPSFSVELLDGISGTTLKTVSTDGSGSFDFEYAGRGLYFVAPRFGGDNPGRISVAVQQDAPVDQMNIDFAVTSCGLQYVDRSQCPEPPLHLARLGGRISDPSQVARAGANVFLLDSEDRPVKQTSSDRTGEFSFGALPSGVYQLVIQSPGFSPLRRTLAVDSEGDGFALGVFLWIVGGCSTAIAQ